MVWSSPQSYLGAYACLSMDTTSLHLGIEYASTAILRTVPSTFNGYQEHCPLCNNVSLQWRCYEDTAQWTSLMVKIHFLLNLAYEQYHRSSLVCACSQLLGLQVSLNTHRTVHGYLLPLAIYDHDWTLLRSFHHHIVLMTWLFITMCLIWL